MDQLHIPFARLQEATAFVHTFHGSELRMRTTDGATVVVAHHPAADISPCDLRRVVVASACPTRPDPSRWIQTLEVGGSLIHHGAGVYRDSSETHQWTIATRLAPATVSSLLESLDLEAEVTESVDAFIRPDRSLGVSTVTFRPNARLCPDDYGQLHDVAVEAQSALVAAEVIAQPHGVAIDPRPVRRHP